MKHIFIINPVAGSRDRTKEYKEQIEKSCICRDLSYEIHVSQYAGEFLEAIVFALYDWNFTALQPASFASFTISLAASILLIFSYSRMVFSLESPIFIFRLVEKFAKCF